MNEYDKTPMELKLIFEGSIFNKPQPTVRAQAFIKQLDKSHINNLLKYILMYSDPKIKELISTIDKSIPNIEHRSLSKLQAMLQELIGKICKRKQETLKDELDRAKQYVLQLENQLNQSNNPIK